ncbi:MAG: hypothetical protein Fur0016_04930 [Anaerolineales bacterium]
MSKFSRLLPLLALLLAALACSLPGIGSAPPPVQPSIEIPTFTPTAQVEIKPTDLPAPPTLTPEPGSPQPLSLLDPRAIPGCDIFIDADFPNTLGSLPDTKQDLSEEGKKACQYNFSNGVLVVSISTSLPGREAFENVRQFDALSGAAIESIPLGDIAILKTFDDGRFTLEAVLNGWYVVLDAQGFDRKHLLLLADLLLNNLVAYR